MGALHLGHISLIRRARQENDRVVVSIFVNPLQFGPNEDLEAYPRTLEQDVATCEAAQVDAIFCPHPRTLYTADTSAATLLTQVIPPEPLTQHLCGPRRPGHFAGVTTVVAKLFNLVTPNRAYFGRKDAQQLAIIKHMVADLNWPVKVIGCDIVRESDGLAYSSRNEYLTATQRYQATTLYTSLQAAKTAFAEGERQAQSLIAAAAAKINLVPSIRVEYLEMVHPATLQPMAQVDTVGLLAIAAHLGSVVVGVEDQGDVVTKAAEALSDLGLDNAAVIEAPLSEGVAKQGPYDVILVAGGVEDNLETLKSQLSEEGGRLVTIIVENGVGHATLFTRHGASFGQRRIFEAHPAGILPGFERAPAFVF